MWPAVSAGSGKGILYTTLSPVLNAELASWYASLVGMLGWMVEIGQVDIITVWLSQDQVQLRDVL